MVDHPKKPFLNASLGIPPKEEIKEPDTIRDKDNADHVIKPPRLTPFRERNRAGRGAIGTKRNLPTPQDQKAKRFETTERGALKNEFKPIARGQSKDRGWER